MKSATLGQAAKILEIFKDASSERIQALLELGFLADLRDGDIERVNRFKFRGMLGLAMLESTFNGDIEKDKWTLLEHNPRQLAFVSGLEPVSFLKNGEKGLKSNLIARRALSLGISCGYEDAKWLCVHQNEIPREFRRFDLIFPGTAWADERDNFYISYLYWCDTRWRVGFCSECNRNSRFVRSRGERV